MDCNRAKTTLFSKLFKKQLLYDLNEQALRGLEKKSNSQNSEFGFVPLLLYLKATAVTVSLLGSSSLALKAEETSCGRQDNNKLNPWLKNNNRRSHLYLKKSK